MSGEGVEAVVGLAKNADNWRALALVMCLAQHCDCDVGIYRDGKGIWCSHDDGCGIFQFRNRELS